MVLGHRPDVVAGAVATTNGPAPPAEKYMLGRPTDVAWDPQGNIFVSDGYINNRVVKYDKNGRFLAQVGSEKAGHRHQPVQPAARHRGGCARQRYVADRSNHRLQVFDNNLAFKAIYDNIGDSWTVCVSPGPHQYLFTSNSNPNGNAPGSWDITRRDLQDGTGRHDRRQVRPCRQAAGRVPGGSHDGLPQSRTRSSWRKSNPGACRN